MGLTAEHIVVALAALPLLGATLNGLFGHRFAPVLAATLACGTTLLSAAAATLLLATRWPFAEVVSVPFYRWLEVGDLKVDVGFVIDGVAAMVAMVVTWTTLGLQILLWGTRPPQLPVARVYAFMSLLVFSLLVVAFGASLPVVFAGCQAIGVCAYVLLGLIDDGGHRRGNAAKTALVFQLSGDLGIVGAMLVLLANGSTLLFADMARSMPSGDASAETLATIGACVIGGVFLKSASLALLAWPEGAHARSASVSALLASATMMTGGALVVFRMAWVVELSSLTAGLCVGLGVALSLLGAVIASVQVSLRRALGYLALCQVGFLWVAMGFGMTTLAPMLALTGGLAVAASFAASGVVVGKQGGELDLMKMGGHWRKSVVSLATVLVAMLVVGGVPFASTFLVDRPRFSGVFLGAPISAPATRLGGELSPAAYVVLAAVGLALAFASFAASRVFLLTFFSGRSRASDSDASAADGVSSRAPIHTALPLGALVTILVLTGGLLWPMALGFGWEGIPDWLGPRTSPWGGKATAGGTVPTTGLVFASSIVAGWLAGLALYASKIHPFAHLLAVELPTRRVYRFVQSAFFFDVAIRKTLLTPGRRFAQLVVAQGIEARLIDGTMTILVATARSFAFLLQLFQNGNIQRYLAIFVLALAAILYGWFAPHPSPFGIDRTLLPAIHAEPGPGRR